MNIILALRGRGGIGKTTTIIELAKLLPTLEYIKVAGKYIKRRKDLVDVYEHKTNGKRIGISSGGDDDNVIIRDFKHLLGNDCNLCICAARLYGSSNEAIERVPNYTKLYFPKTIATKPGSRNRVNAKDAKDMLAVIKILVH